MVLKSLGLIQTVVFDELLDGAICQPALDEVVAQGGEVAALLGGDAILLRAELSVNVAAALGLVDGEDGNAVNSKILMVLSPLSALERPGEHESARKSPYPALRYR